MKPSFGVPKSESTGVPGWETEAEERELMRLARAYVPDGGVIVELGGEFGRSAAQFAKACKGKSNILIVTVDLFPDNHPQVGDLLFAWKANLAEARVTSDQITLRAIKSDTVLMGMNWDGSQIDLLFIDAGHGYNQVVADIMAWVSHVKPGGIVAFHDYAKIAEAHILHHEVARAVDEWYGANKADWIGHEAPDSLVWFQRKKADYTPTRPQPPLPGDTVQEIVSAVVNRVIEKQHADELYTVAELVELTGLSRSALRRKLKGIEPRAVDGKTHLYALEDVQDV